MANVNKNDQNKRHTVNISHEAYLKAKEMVQDGKTLMQYIIETILVDYERTKFVKMYTPYLKIDYISEDAVYIKDSKSNKIAVVRLKEHPDTDLDNSGFFAICETCKSENCIHVMHSLVTGSIMQLNLSDKMV